MKPITYLILFFTFLSCHSNIEKLDGEELAKVNCSSCHLFPEPDLLDQKSWEKHILPRMGFMLGVLPKDSIGVDFIEPFAEKTAYSNPLLFQQKNKLKKGEWQAIKNFYLNNAPYELITDKLTINSQPLKQFKIKYPSYFLSPPSTTLINIKTNKLFMGDAHSHKLYLFDQNNQLINLANAGQVPVWLNEYEKGYLITDMGSFSPTDAPIGQVIYLPKDKKQLPMILVDNLRRPVHTEMADLNNDGRLDLIISEFAKWTGCLAWWENDGKGGFKKHLLRDMPGAIRAYAHDMNNDNLLDIVSLFGQGDEGIFIYYNQGNNSFREERILRFPPSYGSSFFDLFDHNNDGFMDIIYTNGDNADFPPILKPYHGIRIYENNGKNKFKEIFFQPMPGAYNAITKDFDSDGDLDIAAISFFPDFKNSPDNSFIYFENNGDWKMEAFTFPNAEKGRWITLGAGDLDDDGDLDLALGSLAFEVLPKSLGLEEKWVKNGIPFIILENINVVVR